ncbi:hypothetical protein CSKR_110664 [Clonorchis sinensis]|uniref:Uncharacterized protein n=1 Tax=Clonorchis sinensis TaxID=79923 RepID=A0A3R7CWV7_CLOSI|nr:hypothetical protein CSKR_110664 [Clonorchis sinensis]
MDYINAKDLCTAPHSAQCKPSVGSWRAHASGGLTTVDRVTSKPPGKTKGTLEARRNVFQPSTRTDTLQTSAQPQQRRGLSSAQRESSFTISIPPRQSVPETNAHTTVVPNRNGSSQPALSLQIPPTGFPCGGSTPKSSPLSAGVSDSDQNGERLYGLTFPCSSCITGQAFSVARRVAPFWSLGAKPRWLSYCQVPQA